MNFVMENKLTESEHARDASEQIIKKRKIRPAGMEPHRRRIIISETVRQFLLRNRHGFRLR